MTRPSAPTSSAVPGLEVSGLSKRFGSWQALDRVSFRVVPGEFLGLIGPNGAGKTTLLECLAGLLPADSGAVTWQGRSLAPGERRRILWYQPDGIRPYARQPVGATLAFFRSAQGAPAAVLEALVAELELETVLNKSMQALSKGYGRRVLLAIALLSRRPVLLLDEPFDGFDVRRSLAVMDLLRRHRTDRAMILSIHQLSEAEKICDRFLLLDQGRVLGAGTLEDLRRQAGLTPRARLEEVFLAIT